MLKHATPDLNKHNRYGGNALIPAAEKGHQDVPTASGAEGTAARHLRQRDRWVRGAGEAAGLLSLGGKGGSILRGKGGSPMPGFSWQMHRAGIYALVQDSL